MQKVSQLFEELIRREAALLAEQKIVHGPTIGGMYEGLSAAILDQALPLKGTDLRITRGFMRARDGKQLSSEIDCMIVVGEGEPVPYTDRFIYPVDQVLVILEVKKNLTRELLAETMVKFADLEDICAPMTHNYLSDDGFARMLGKRPIAAGNPDLWGEGSELIADVVITGANLPLRVILDYSGYKTGKGLLQAYVKEMIDLSESDDVGRIGHPAYWPDLIVGMGIEITKLFATPYSCERGVGELGIVGLSSGQFGLVFLESILWRIAHHIDPYIPIYADYAPPPILQVYSIEMKGDEGTMKYLFPENAPQCTLQIDLDENPKELNPDQMLLALLFIKGGPFPADDPEIWTNLDLSEEAFREALDYLVSNGVFDVEGDRAYGLFTLLGVAIRPDKGGFCAENCRGALDKWVGKVTAEAAKAQGQKEVSLINVASRELFDLQEKVVSIKQVDAESLLSEPGMVERNRFETAKLVREMFAEAEQLPIMEAHDDLN